ncbi:MAG: hypothetical protein ACLGHY_11890 [Gammaproteobacteria bacterium]
MFRLAPSHVPPRAPAAAVPARDSGALDSTFALDRRTVWPTHRIRGFLISRLTVLPPAR